MSFHDDDSHFCNKCGAKREEEVEEEEEEVESESGSVWQRTAEEERELEKELATLFPSEGSEWLTSAQLFDRYQWLRAKCNVKRARQMTLEDDEGSSAVGYEIEDNEEGEEIWQMKEGGKKFPNPWAEATLASFKKNLQVIGQAKKEQDKEVREAQSQALASLKPSARLQGSLQESPSQTSSLAPQDGPSSLQGKLPVQRAATQEKFPMVSALSMTSVVSMKSQSPSLNDDASASGGNMAQSKKTVPMDSSFDLGKVVDEDEDKESCCAGIAECAIEQTIEQVATHLDVAREMLESFKAKNSKRGPNAREPPRYRPRHAIFVRSETMPQSRSMVVDPTAGLGAQQARFIKAEQRRLSPDTQRGVLPSPSGSAFENTRKQRDGGWNRY